jgi:hypothetical protein
MILKSQSFETASGRTLVVDWSRYEGLISRNVVRLHYVDEEGIFAGRTCSFDNDAIGEEVFEHERQEAENEARNSWIWKEFREREEAARERWL